MLHGWMDNAASFCALAPLLHAREIVALELPGHGHSQHRPAGVHYHFVDYIADVVAAVEVLGWERFVLLGHSLGAAVAGFTAGVLQQRVARLVFIEGLGPISGNPEQAPQRLARSIRQLSLIEQQQPKRLDSLEAAARLRARNSDLQQDAARVLVKRGTRATANGLYWRHDPRLAHLSPVYLTEQQVHAFLGAIENETLLVQAEQGLLVTRSTTRGRCERIKRLTQVCLAGGHHLHMESPAAVAAAINRFIGADDAAD